MLVFFPFKKEEVYVKKGVLLQLEKRTQVEGNYIIIMSIFYVKNVKCWRIISHEDFFFHEEK